MFILPIYQFWYITTLALQCSRILILEDFEFISREEILGGLPAKRASTLLFAIESRTAHCVAISRQAMELYLTDEAAEERDLAFLQAIAQGRDPLPQKIQGLERYAPKWALLVPDNPRVRAALAQLLGKKYNFTPHSVPGIRAALGLDEEAVQQAYQDLYKASLETIFAPRYSLSDRLHWASARASWWLESLPPFWTVFALTLTETVGAGILALPIALATIGPLAGIAILVVLGLVNVLTIAYMAEAVSRSGIVRYQSAFIGRVVTDYLGGAGSLIVTVALIVRGLVVLLAYYIGFSTQMEVTTRLPAVMWAGLLFLVGFFFLRRKSLNATVASALLVGFINISLILILSFLALTHMKPTSLLYVNLPGLSGGPFRPSFWQLVFGVILSAYFGHLSTSNSARVVLRRDPSARSLIWGSTAAMGTVIGLYCVWVLTISGAVGRQELVGQKGTVLDPLAAVIGPIANVLGFVLVISALGMASIHVSLGLFNLVRERLPSRPKSVEMLLQQHGRLLFHPRGTAGISSSLHIGLNYLGLAPKTKPADMTSSFDTLIQPEPRRGDDQPQFRLEIQSGGHTLYREITVHEYWETTTLLGQIPELGQPGVGLAFEVLGADQESVRVRVTSLMSLTYDGEWDIPSPGPETSATATISPPANIPTIAQQAGETLMGERRRFFLSVSPVGFVFFVTVCLLLTGRGSFVGFLSFSGVIGATIFAGIIPVLLLVATRRKGELVPDVVYHFLGHPVLIISLYFLFVSNFFLHGLIIWQNPLLRVGSFIVGVLVLGVTLVMVRRGVFRRRVVVELRKNTNGGGKSIFAVTTSGRPVPTQVQLGYSGDQRQFETATAQIPQFSQLRYVAFNLSANQGHELKVWAHELMPDGDSQGLPALLEVNCGPKSAQYDLKLTGGQVVMPINGHTCQLKITLPDPGKDMKKQATIS